LYRRNICHVIHLESKLENPEHVDPRMGFSRLGSAQVKPVDEGIDDPDGVIFGYLVIEA
jgi:hypothetical protein